MKAEKQNWAVAVTRKENVFLLKSKIGEKMAWYYLDVLPNKIAMFKKRVGKESLNLEEYGKILFSGWGSEPPEKIRKSMEED